MFYLCGASGQAGLPAGGSRAGAALLGPASMSQPVATARPVARALAWFIDRVANATAGSRWGCEGGASGITARAVTAVP